MSAAPPESGAAECRRVLESLLAAGSRAGAADLLALRDSVPGALDDAVRAFADAHGAEALPVLGLLTSDRAGRPLRRAARRALYRLSQRGISAPPPAPARPVVARQPERAVRAWVSAVDGSGSRAAWILFEGGYGGVSLCALILSDVAGIVEVAGGDISKKRLETELTALRAEQKLPWVETDPGRAVGLVSETLRLHAEHQTSPPEGFARWRRLFESAPPPAPPPLPREVDRGHLERSAELLELPEMAGWFLDPEAVQTDGLELLGARESRLVVSDQVKAEREEAIVSRVVERELPPDVCARWSRRLSEMALVFAATGRAEPQALAEAAAAALADPERDPRHHPLAQALARRALEIAADVALGKVKAADVSRKPGPVTTAAPAAPATPRG